MPTLHDRFADLAEEAPESPTPPRIWDEGRRRARAARVGTAIVVVATLVLGVFVAGTAVRRSAEPQYAGPTDGAPVLPTQVHQPSRWLGTATTPPGRLSMAIPAEQAVRSGLWNDYRWGVVGVSATTGAYHFLDVPDCVSFISLSADCEHVACFTGVGPLHHAVVDGLMVYDTATGHLDRWTGGPGPLRLNSIGWNGNDVLTLRLGATSYEWRFGYGAPRPITTRLTQTAGTADTTALYRARAGYFYLDPARSGQVVRIRVEPGRDSHNAFLAALSPSGQRLAKVIMANGRGRLEVGTVGRSRDPVRLGTVPVRLHVSALVGWSDERHVVVTDQPGGPASADGVGPPAVLERIDVQTGRVEQVSHLAPGLGLFWISFASSTLGAPARDLPAPPTPMDPRVVVGLVVGLVLAGAVGVVLWRRRVRA